MSSRAPQNAADRPPASWGLKQPFGLRAVAFALVAVVVLGLSARRTEIDRMIAESAGYAAYLVGLKSESTVAPGVHRYLSNAYPVIAEITPTARISGFDRAHLPFLSHVEMRDRSTTVYDQVLEKTVTKTESEEVLVQPAGYLFFVIGKMVESLEIALWGTLVAIILGAPIAYLGTRGYSPHPALYALARAVAAFFRALPELVSALFLVLAFGFGPIAGVLALGLHSAGFFGKFFADDIENAERGPQEAIASLGASDFKVLWFGALPQVLPQYIAYVQYILERNVRMSTVIGIVGAGGIGIELKGRFDQYNFGHVTTILLVLFVAILGLERLSHWVRGKLL